jgi:hypothetical protein
MHADPTPLFHRDIRWPNIIRKASTKTKWFLVDWDNASTSPTTAALHLDRGSHSPRVFEPNHGAEVDIWGAGKLITDAVIFAPHISAAMLDLGTRMVLGNIGTAAEALEILTTI